MRYIVIGDLHGCIEEFNELLIQTKYVKGQDFLIIAGDVFDRGPDSLGCLRRIREVGGLLVLGNHDEKHLRYALHEDKKRTNPSYKNPMRPFFGQRLEAQNSLNKEDLEQLKIAPLMYQFDNWVVVHAGLERKPVYKQDRAILRVRYIDKDTGLHSKLPDCFDAPPNSIYWADDWIGPENVVYGHAVHDLTNPKITYNGSITYPVWTLGIDTGCCFGGNLTAAIIVDGKFVEFKQVKAKKAYKAMTKDSHKE
jgi:bis(5'-nucleosyl)-tetraphosphatase (symmetrical)